MIILAIETSCDDTCVAILEAEENKNPHFKILSNIVSSQVKIHAKYGGVYPFLAKREHQRNLAPVLKKALEEARLLNSKCKMQNAKLPRPTSPSAQSKAGGQFKIQNLNLNKTLSRKIDLIAVTVGPGLEPCLWTGINFAKSLAKKLNLPLVPVNHVEAHIFANFIDSNTKYKIQDTRYIFPAVCLVVSGGHTQLILMKGFGKYKILGETRDDAAGECFDKTARILGLGYPGGPAIAAEAAKYKIQDTKYKIQLPRPMIYQKNYDFSFSGLKTAVLYLVKQLTANSRQLTLKQKIEICAEVQQAVIDVLIRKTLRAAREHKVKTIILGGGVVANEELRKQFKSIVKCQMSNVKFFAPAKNLCTDNAAMVAMVGYFHGKKGRKKKTKNIEASANLRL